MMPDNLAPPSGNSSDRRPHQQGEARGFKSGLPVSADKEWMVDTGAQISVITKSNGDKFDLTAVGGSASGTTGGGRILVKSGLEMVFEVFDPAGVATTVTCSLDVGVKPNNKGSEILGMDQIADVGAIVEWDPGTRTGRLRQPTGPLLMGGTPYGGEQAWWAVRNCSR
jgi:hypothetical protein